MYKFSSERSSPLAHCHRIQGGVCGRVLAPKTPELSPPPRCKESRVGAPPQPKSGQTPTPRCGALRLCKP